MENNLRRFGLVTLSVMGVSAADTALAAGRPERLRQTCQLCHEVGGVGGKKKDVGGELDGVGAKRDEASLRAYIVDGKFKVPDPKMKVFHLAPADMDGVVARVMTLKTK